MSIKKHLALAIASTLTMFSTSTFGWKGDVELGYSHASGNSRTTVTNGKYDLEHPVAKWLHNLFGDGYYATDTGTKTAERYTAGYRPKYFTAPNNYVFAMFRYDQDTFAFTDRRLTEVVGFGRRFVETPEQQLEAELGAGARQINYAENTSVSGLTADEFVFFLGSKYNVKLSETAKFSSTLRVDSGHDNTFSEWTNSLTLAVIGNVGAKLGYNLRHNSNIRGTQGEKYDTVASVNGVYHFK